MAVKLLKLLMCFLKCFFLFLADIFYAMYVFFIIPIQDGGPLWPPTTFLFMTRIHFTMKFWGHPVFLSTLILTFQRDF